MATEYDKIDLYHYAWRVPSNIHNMPTSRLLVPYPTVDGDDCGPFDFIYETPEDALQGLRDNYVLQTAIEENWQLIKVSIEVVKIDITITDDDINKI